MTIGILLIGIVFLTSVYVIFGCICNGMTKENENTAANNYIQKKEGVK